MTTDDFFELILKNLYFNLGLYFIILVTIILLFRKNINMILDPLIITLIANSSIIFVLVILKYNNLIKDKNYYQLILITICFLSFLKFFLSLKVKNVKSKIKNIYELKIFYFLHTILFIIVTYFYLKIASSGIGFSNKLDMFKNNGVLNYLVTAIFPGQIILITLKREVYKKNKLDYVVLAIAFMDILLMGGKTNFIFCVIYIYYTNYILFDLEISTKFKKIKKIEKKIMIFCGIVVFFSFKYIKKAESLYSVVSQIIIRVISEADIYFMYYAKDAYLKINSVTVYNYYLQNLFSPLLKRIGVETGPRELGFSIVSFLYKIKNPNFGPNTRAEVIWQSNIGYFGIIISFIGAYLFYKVRNSRSNKYMWIYVQVLLIVNIDLFFRDFGLLSLLIVGIILIILPIKFVLSILQIVNKNKKIIN